MSNESEQKALITNIEKSKSDKFDCVIKILPNNLKALLVSDPEAELSAAALGVNIGSLSDNPDELGLAHFCEHLLFMGTKKYPSENEYEDYLSKNGGESNAYTDLDKTIYYFDVDNDAFEGAIDRFAQFFICPTFNEGSVERELLAVDSEHCKNKNLDDWRFYELFISQLAEDSVFNKFSTGNKETLNHPDIRDRLLKMYNKYYSSDIMYLVMYSKLPLDNLIKLTDELFSLVPKIDNLQLPKYDIVKPYNENTMGYFYKVVPVKDEDKINFTWYLPFCENYHAKPINFLSSVFGHEGPNTLTASLKRDNLISDLTTSKNHYAKTFSTFEIEVELTKKGYDNYKEVILRVLNYVKTIKGKNINKRYFNETRDIAQINFDFRNKKKPDDFVEKNCEYFMLYNLEDVFTGKTIYKEYNEELIRKYFDLLTLDNLNISFSSKSLEKDCNLAEKWYGTKYSKEKLKITKEEIDSYKCEHVFDYPPENKFCPKNMDILPEPESPAKYPEKILDEKNCKLWFLQDTYFKLPKGSIKVEFKFVKNLCYNSQIKNAAISYLLKKIIKLELNEIIYMASEADTKFKIKIFFNRLEITMYGYNDSLKNGLNELLTNIKNLNLNTEKYREILNIQIKECIKKKNNFYYDKSYKVSEKYIEQLLLVPNIEPKDLVEFLTNVTITIEDLIAFKNNMFIDVQSDWLIQGNLQKQTALEIVQMSNEIFNIDTKKNITKPFYDKRAVELRKNNNYIYRFLNPNKDEKDSSIMAIYQFGQLSGEEKIYFFLLNSFLSEKFYDILRTKETLGYVVYLTTKTICDVRHLVGVIQSSGKCPEYCTQRVRAFFKEKEKDINEITDEVFNSHVKSRLLVETKKDRDMKEQFNRNWTEITLGRYKFNIKEENAEILKKCNKEGFIKFYKKYCIDEIKKLDIEYVCESHMEENEKKILDQGNDDSLTPGIKKRIGFNKISDFQDCNSFYPYISTTYYNELSK